MASTIDGVVEIIKVIGNNVKVCKYVNIDNYFENPVESKDMGIYLVSEQGVSFLISKDALLYKNYRIPLEFGFLVVPLMQEDEYSSTE